MDMTDYDISTVILVNRHPFEFFYTVCRKSCHLLLIFLTLRSIFELASIVNGM